MAGKDKSYLCGKLQRQRRATGTVDIHNRLMLLQREIPIRCKRGYLGVKHQSEDAHQSLQLVVVEVRRRVLHAEEARQPQCAFIENASGDVL